MIFTRELAAGTVIVDSTAMTYTLNGGPVTPVPSGWVAWVQTQVTIETLAAEAAQIRDALAAGIADLQAALTTAGQVRDAETARAAAVRASTPAVSLAYVTAIRDDIALIHDRLALIASGTTLAYQDLIGLAQLAQRQLG